MIKVIFVKDYYVWHRWFAWYPIRIEIPRIAGAYCYKRIWLETVERRFVGGWGCISKKYRELSHDQT